ncbi:hypothetical protein VPH35_129314 [Triticum aestivum]
MWLYSGPDDTARVHPEEVSSATVALWMRSITGNQDNPRGSRRVVPFSSNNTPDKVFTEMHSMPNGEQDLEQAQEGEDSAEDSDKWDSQEDDDEEEESEESVEEEEVDSPPRSERRSKQQHDPAGSRRKGVGPSANSQKRTQTLTPEPTEKVAKQPKVARSKARKKLPRIKMDVPVALGPTSAATDMDVNKAPGDEEATS